MTVVSTATGFDVVEGDRVLAAGFATSAAAWRWIDRQEGAPISKREDTAAWSWNKRVHGE